MTIGQLARQSALRTSAVRYYESIGLLRASRVNGRRHFDEDAAARLRLIQVAKNASFSLQEIRAILAADRPDWQHAASLKLLQLDQAIARAYAQREAVARMLRCSCKTIAECAVKSRDAGIS